MKKKTLFLMLAFCASLNVGAQEKHAFDKGDADTLVYEQLITANLQNRQGKNEILFDVRYPLESMTNLILNYVENNGRTLAFNHHQYGNVIKSGKIPMQVMYDLFAPHMEMYCMVTKIDKETVNATLVFRNVKLDFIHMLVFKTPMNDIFKKDGTLYAELYTNIPQSDIRNLFPNPKNYRYKR